MGMLCGAQLGRKHFRPWLCLATAVEGGDELLHLYVQLQKRIKELDRTWTEAVMHAAAKAPELKRFYQRKLIQKGMGKARIAAARNLGIRLWIMMRDQIDYEEFCRRGKLWQSGKAHAGMPDCNRGPARAVTG